MRDFVVGHLRGGEPTRAHLDRRTPEQHDLQHDQRAVGAGLLSSFGELGRFKTEAELLPFNLDEVIETPFDPTDYQVTLFVSESTESLLGQLTDWLTPQARKRSS